MKRTYLIIGLKLGLSIGLLVYLFIRLDRPNISDLITNFHPLVWSAAVCLIMVQLFLLSYRWHLLINIGRRTMNFWQSLQLSLASLLANTIFLSGISGVGVRIAMSLYYGASVFKSLVVTVLDRLMSVAILGFFVAVTLPALSTLLPPSLFPLPPSILTVILLLGFVMALPLGFLLLKILAGFNITFFGGMNAVRFISLLGSDHIRLLKISAVSFVAQISFFAAVYIIAFDRIPEMPAWPFISILPAICFISSLPISIGGWGVREGAFVYGLSLISINNEAAFILSIEIGLLSMIATIVAGAPALWLSDRMIKNETGNAS